MQELPRSTMASCRCLDKCGYGSSQTSGQRCITEHIDLNTTPLVAAVRDRQTQREYDKVQDAEADS